MTPDSHWSGAQAVPTGPGDCREPAVTVAGEVLHAVWTQGSNLYHACLSGGSWSAPKRVAAGSQAALATAPDGVVHCLFSAQMLGNVEIYHTSWNGAEWTLPEVVSRTSGVSNSPALAVGKDGSLHAAWADTTPGYSTIYYGRRVAAGWTSVPIPNGSGSYPALAVDPGGQIYAAWQSRSPATGRFEVYCAQSSQWGLGLAPEYLSQQPEPFDLPQSGDHCAGHWPPRLARGSRRHILHSARRPVSQRLVREP